jgi:hypothetical protein
MMSGMPLETCWAFSEFWNNKFYYKFASCWLFLLIQSKVYYRINESPQMDTIPDWLNLADILKLLFLQPTIEMILLSMVVLEKVNSRLAKKFYSFYRNHCSKHIACCHSRSQMNPFRADALPFFKVNLMYLVQLSLPSVPFQIFHKTLCSFLFSRV